MTWGPEDVRAMTARLIGHDTGRWQAAVRSADDAVLAWRHHPAQAGRVRWDRPEYVAFKVEGQALARYAAACDDAVDVVDDPQLLAWLAPFLTRYRTAPTTPTASDLGLPGPVAPPAGAVGDLVRRLEQQLRTAGHDLTTPAPQSRGADPVARLWQDLARPRLPDIDPAGDAGGSRTGDTLVHLLDWAHDHTTTNV